ncbi:MAG: transcriptional regulator GcvA [Tistlia sp.]|uniref:transcriptional regulator GcvA n=1 Tax=Tistlia sp. TaxID=3057121 RepID=UPI0034A1CC27
MQSLRDRLPPPNALVAFEAAARHLSFTSAAGELNVTRVAVSSQVKQLEEFLGTGLFLRLHRALRLTPAGEILGRRLSASLGDIAATVESIREDNRNQRLTITTSTGFVTYWLLPRISDFRRQHPDIDLRLLVSDSYLNLSSESVDVAVRYGSGGWQGVDARPLVQERIFPVCSPGFLVEHGCFQRPEELLSQRLLHLDGPYDAETRWATWFSAQGIDPVPPLGGLFLNTYTSLVQAALDGQGIALLGPPLLARALADGSLVRPIEVAPTLRRTFWLVSPQQSVPSPAAQTFCTWIAAAMSAAP